MAFSEQTVRLLSSFRLRPSHLSKSEPETGFLLRALSQHEEATSNLIDSCLRGVRRMRGEIGVATAVTTNLLFSPISFLLFSSFSPPFSLLTSPLFSSRLFSSLPLSSFLFFLSSPSLTRWRNSSRGKAEHGSPKSKRPHPQSLVGFDSGPCERAAMGGDCGLGDETSSLEETRISLDGWRCVL